ncbi:NAD(P)H-dependent oxidoreductase [uncultured Cyclobacterium sp.]|uniref:NAD(P)H-dependent oxidoreductase n=1 Tax=uncultured Cyclobacterium sp. TaxID=453820 RepID=UPI0030EC6854|tara:strand:- start:77592 stop:78209 length:618 start_codon:yes stop_codon:yes gene_type:complete
MKNIFVINGGHQFAHSPGRFNRTLLEKTKQFFEAEEGFAVKTTQVGEEYNLTEEVEKFKWADIVFYHFPVWWFQVPFGLKAYIDRVFTAGHQSGIYHSDGRSRNNPAINYGTGGSLHGKKYVLTSSWNAPEEAFCLKGEFFDQKSVDEGPLYGFHKMNQFVGLSLLGSIHFHDMEKNADVEAELSRYENFLKMNFIDKELTKALP